MHYNYYRTYNPLVGRYIQSDPLGLAAGFNTYNYVEGNPFGRIDTKGLNTQILRLYDPVGVDHLALRFVKPGSPALITSMYSDREPIAFVYAKPNLVFDTDKSFTKKYNDSSLRLQIIELATTIDEEQEIQNRMVQIENTRMFTGVGSGIQCTKSINLSMSSMGLPLLNLNILSTPASFINNLLDNEQYKKRIINHETKKYPYF